jgi:hypothetical protein
MNDVRNKRKNLLSEFLNNLIIESLRIRKCSAGIEQRTLSVPVNISFEFRAQC